MNRKQYPDWDSIVDNWAKDGVRPMVYMNPYFANLTGNPDIRDNLFKEGDDNGFFVKNLQNKSYLIKSLSIEFAMIDFTNPEARTWGKNIIKKNMIEEAKSVGWMCDFAEYTPMMAKYHNFSGASQTYHNRYPYEWAKLNQEAVAEAGQEDEIVYFMRAGSTFSPSVTSLYWMGDQLSTYDKFDGLQSAMIGLLNGGMSGYGIGHSDIGGYTTIN